MFMVLRSGRHVFLLPEYISFWTEMEHVFQINLDVPCFDRIILTLCWHLL
uniref:Uncharacterized protein n=1 Tax=Arundo donax TaxID=35708 RepID=A0A0A9AE79_ARUDO